MTPLRQRMTDAMLQRGFCFRTQESYVDAIYGMAKHYRRDPAEYTAKEVEVHRPLRDEAAQRRLCQTFDPAFAPKPKILLCRQYTLTHHLFVHTL